MDFNGKKMYHIGCTGAQVGKYCLLPGDPGRCEAIAKHLDNAAFVSQNREFTVWTGFLNGEKVTVCSTGIGGPSAAIAVEELYEAGARTFVRIGTCGGIKLTVEPGDVVIAVSAVRQEGTSREYAPIEYPATADFCVVRALVEATEKRGARHHVGVVQSKDSFYGQHSPNRMPVGEKLIEKWSAWKKLGVLASEMETAALFCAASALKDARCGALYLALWNQERASAGIKDAEKHDTSCVIQIAVDALKSLIEAER